MEKIFIEAIYELTQAIEVLALKVDELDQTNAKLLEQNERITQLYKKLVENKLVLKDPSASD
ncbi:MAG TPA: hypothetical protein VL092_01015 [Chitinophagaceae bacterium]|nr:hypothetical protein [Chitinophagaceae bacterium]